MGIGQFINDLALTRAAYRVFAGHLFHRYFNAVAASSDELRREVYRIRYDVYCDELRFEDPARFPDKQEIDPYDRLSLHCLLLHRTSNTFAGCVRFVGGGTSGGLVSTAWIGSPCGGPKSPLAEPPVAPPGRAAGVEAVGDVSRPQPATANAASDAMTSNRRFIRLSPWRSTERPMRKVYPSRMRAP